MISIDIKLRIAEMKNNLSNVHHSKSQLNFLVKVNKDSIADVIDHPVD